MPRIFNTDKDLEVFCSDRTYLGKSYGDFTYLSFMGNTYSSIGIYNNEGNLIDSSLCTIK